MCNNTPDTLTAVKRNHLSFVIALGQQRQARVLVFPALFVLVCGRKSYKPCLSTPAIDSFFRTSYNFDVPSFFFVLNMGERSDNMDCDVQVDIRTNFVS